MSEEEAINKCREIMRREATEDCDAEAINTVLKALANLNDNLESELEYYKYKGIYIGTITGLVVGLIMSVASILRCM